MQLELVFVWAGIGLIFFCLTMWAFIDFAHKEYDTIQQKALWGFIALIPFIGWIIYFLIGTRKAKRTTPP